MGGGRGGEGGRRGSPTRPRYADPPYMAVFATSVPQKHDTFAIGNRSNLVKHKVSELQKWPHLVQITAGIERDTRKSFFNDLFFTDNTANYNVFV